MSLRWKIALVLAAIASVATVAVGALGYRSTRDRLYGEIDRSLLAIDARVSERWFALTDERPAPSPFAGFDAQFVQADGVVVQTTFREPLPVTDADLRIVGRPGRSAFTTVDTADGTYRVRTEGVPRGAVQIGRSLDETERVLRSLRTRTLLWTLVVVAAAVAAGLWIADRVTASLRRLTAAAEQVESTGRLDVRVGEAGSDEVGRLGAAFDRMLAALSRSKEDQQRLVQDAGHELRTPLTSLRTNVDALERYRSMSEDDRDAIVADLRAETSELTHLVNEIVSLASGALSDEPFEPFDLSAVTSDVVNRFERRLGREIRLDSVGTPVVAQRASVQRAISCLLDNARKFDHSDDGIIVTVRDGGVTVRDHGPGIPEDELSRVFDRFHRAESARTLPGSGLGLSIVREIAERHDGTATAQNAPDGGAVVGFRLGR